MNNTLNRSRMQSRESSMDGRMMNSTMPKKSARRRKKSSRDKKPDFETPEPSDNQEQPQLLKKLKNDFKSRYLEDQEVVSKRSSSSELSFSESEGDVPPSII